MKLLRVNTVAEMLDCSTSHIYNLIAGGHLQAVKIGKKAGIRVEKESFSLFLAREKNPGPDVSAADGE